MENIGGGMAAPSKSAVGLICLGRQLEQKTAQKACASMSFLLFTLDFKSKMLVGKIFINFLLISHHFDAARNSNGLRLRELVIWAKKNGVKKIKIRLQK